MYEHFILHSLAGLDAVAQLIRSGFKQTRAALCCFWWRLPGYRLQVWLYRNACIPLFYGAQARGTEVKARAGFLQIMRSPKTRSHFRQLRRAAALDQALYFCNPSLLRELRACAAVLQQRADALRQAGHAVVFAPLHFESDMLAAIVCAMVSPGTATVISVHRPQEYGPDEAARMREGGYQLDQFNPSAPAHEIGGRFPALLRAVKRHAVNLVIFPDALPEFTVPITGKSMRTRSSCVFGQPAALHCGLDEMARLAHATAIYFYLYSAQGQIKLHLLGEASHEQIPQMTTAAIETALKRDPHAWILWHWPSLFFFNAGGHA